MSRLSRVVNILRGNTVDRDVEDELEYHIEARAADLIAGGMAPEEAMRAARLRFGNVLRVRESVRDAKVATWLESVLRDARFGLRLLGKHWVATAAAVLSLSLTIGASTAAFSLIDALALRPLPVDEPEKLFHVAWASNGANDFFSYPMFERLRDAARGRARLFGLTYGGPQQMATFEGSGGREEQVRLQWISGDGLATVGVQPAMGRLLTLADDHPDTQTWAVLSYAFWMRRFGGNPDVIGRPFTVALREMHDVRFRIAGVAQKGFHGLEPGEPVDMWLPLTTRLPARIVARKDFGWFFVRGRLLPGISAAQVRERIEPAFGAPVRIMPAVDTPSYMRSLFERPLWIVTAITLVVLLLACGNVACLFAARAEARRREMGLRASIGAGRARLVQQMLIESGLVACAASVLGLGFALAVAPVMVARLKSVDFPAYLDLHPDWRVLAFVLLAAISTTFVAGLMPALRASTVAARRTGFPRPLIAVQVAFSFAALFLAGLLLSSFRNLTRVDPGFSIDDVLECAVYPRATAGMQGPETARRLLQTVSRMPGVLSASLSTSALTETPLGRIGTVGTTVRARETRRMRFQQLGVYSGFFGTMRIPMLAGREFSDADLTTASPEPLIVSEAFARALFPGESSVGKRFEIEGRSGMRPYEIVGVAGNARYHDLHTDMPAVYSPFLSVNRATLEVRLVRDAVARITSLRDEIERANPAIRLTSAAMEVDKIADSLRRDRLLAMLAAFLAAVAVMLAALGLYGMLSFSVARRTREIGIRLALGAPHISVVRLVMRDILLMVVIGVAIGLIAGFLLVRPFGSILYAVSPSDFRSVLLPLLWLMAASAIAVAPALVRAVRVSPLTSLRQD